MFNIYILSWIKSESLRATLTLFFRSNCNFEGGKQKKCRALSADVFISRTRVDIVTWRERKSFCFFFLADETRFFPLLCLVEFSDTSRGSDEYLKEREEKKSTHMNDIADEDRSSARRELEILQIHNCEDLAIKAWNNLDHVVFTF